MIKVGIIGLGAIGRVHFKCWRQSVAGRLVTVSSSDPRKLAGDWSAQEFNLGAGSAVRGPLDDLRRYSAAENLIGDDGVELVDICLPTPLHAPVTIAALRAGKHVLCEKPMALSLGECAAMQAAARESGRRLMIGHCLRYWPHYVKAREILRSGEFGRAIGAQFHRSSAIPAWSSGGWLQDAAASGGVLDMHIHDIDAALWWFGRPAAIEARGELQNGLPTRIDAEWNYADGLRAKLCGSWGAAEQSFRHAFTIKMEDGVLEYDLADPQPALRLHRRGKATVVQTADIDAYQAQLDDFATACIANEKGRGPAPEESALSVEIGLEELRQIAR